MTTEQMISVVDSYYLARAECNEKRLKCSLIAAYAVELGYEAKGYDVARNMEVREHIERMKCCAEAQSETAVVPTYKSLDVAGFIRSNRGDAQLKQALTELDGYWGLVYRHAEMLADHGRELMKEKSGLEQALKEAGVLAENLRAEILELTGRNNKL